MKGEENLNIINSDEKNNHENISAFQNNIYAIKALVSAVEGTLGPKGMDCMLVDDDGNFLITNDGVSILMEMDISHPAAMMMIHAAYAQQLEMGDGTTTMSVIAGQILESALYYIQKGVPVQKLIEGIKYGIDKAIAFIQSKSVPINHKNFEMLKDIACVAGRGNREIVDLIYQAVQYIQEERLVDEGFKLASIIETFENVENKVIEGIIVNKKPLNKELNDVVNNIKIMVIDDALQPEILNEELMNTESGFNRYMENRKRFEKWIHKLIEMNIGAIFIDRNIDEYAEQTLIDAGVIVVNRVASEELIKLSEHTGAKPIKRNVLDKTTKELESYCGRAKKVIYDKKLEHLRIIEGMGIPTATVIVSAATGVIAEERERIAKDAASALQAALKAGFIGGGGTIEIACAVALDNLKVKIDDMRKYGMECVIDGLKKPLYNIIKNAGFNPLEKTEKVIEAMKDGNNLYLGIHCDTGEVTDLLELKIIDPALVKIKALKTACEISEAILKINLILKGKRKSI